MWMCWKMEKISWTDRVRSDYYTEPERKGISYLLTPWSTVLLEKHTAFQLVKKFPAFYVTRRFITAFTSARHLSLSSARSIQSIPSHPTYWRSILILSSHLRLGLPSGLLPSRLLTKTLYTPLSPHTRYTPRPSHSSRFYQPNNNGWTVQKGISYTQQKEEMVTGYVTSCVGTAF